MGKKLHGNFLLFLLFLPILTWGQCPSSVTISADPSNTICEGTTVEFTANHSDGENLQYQWQVNGVNVSGKTDKTSPLSNLKNGDQIRVVIKSSSDTDCTFTSDFYTINVNALSTVDAGGAITAICQGATTVALGGSFGGGATAAVWSDGGAGGTFINNSGSNPGNTTYTASAAANGNITLTLTTSGGSCGSVTASKTLTVNPNPTVNAGGALTAICQGATTIALGGSFGGGATGAVWSDGGAGGTFTNNSGNNPGSTTYTAAANAPATVTLTLTTSGGSCGTLSASKTLTVNPNPTVNAGGAVPAICQGGTTAALGGSFGGGATSAIWTDGGAGGTFSNPNNPNSTYTAAANAPSTVTLTLTTSGGSCGSVSASKTLTVNPNPTVNAGGALTAICQGGTTASLGGSFGGGATSAIWSDGGAGGTFTNNSGNNPGNTTYTAAANAPATVTLTLTTSGGSCGNVSASKTLTVNQNPTVNAGGSVPAICQGGTTIALGGSFGGGATSATWSDGSAGGTFSNPNNPNSTYTAAANAPATITLTLTTSGGFCGTLSASKTINVTPTVIPSVSISASNDNICSSNGQPVTFTATPVNGGSNPTYQWFRNSTPISGATGSTYTATSAQTGNTISVRMTSNAPCAAPNPVNSNGIQLKVFPQAPENWTGNNGKITLPASVCPPANEIDISIPAVANAEYYQWTLPPGFSIVPGYEGKNVIKVKVDATANVGKNQTVTVQAFNPCGSNGSKSASLNIDNFTGVTVPSPTATVCAGNSITVVGTLRGNAAFGTWTASTGNFTNVVTSGTNPTTVTATYTPSITEGTVDLTITTNAPTGNGCSNSPGTAKITLTVNAPPSITTQPIASQTLCSGNTATFNVAATGTGLTYQWQKNGTNISGANGASFNLNNITTADAGNYQVVITGKNPCTSVTSNVSELIVNEAVAITNQPVEQTICSGNTAEFSVSATGTGLTYQWQKDGIDITNATNATFSIPNATPGNNGKYKVIVSGANPCQAVTSNEVDLVVNEIVAITTQPVPSQTLCSGSTAEFSVEATGTGLAYQWQLDGEDIENATGASLSISEIAANDAGTYTVIISGTDPCETLTSEESVLTVNEIVEINTQPASQVLCSGSTAEFSVEATGTGLAYQWQLDGEDIENATESTLSIANITDANAGDYTVIVSGTDPCEAVTSETANLTVNDIVVIDTQPVSQEICSGSDVIFGMEASGTGLTYQWQKNGNDISGAQDASLSITGATPADAGEYTVVVTGTDPCEPVTSEIANLIVNEPVLITSEPEPSQSVCAGFPVSLSVEATGTGLTYEWLKDGTSTGITTSTLTIDQASIEDNGIYTVKVYGTDPCSSQTSTSAEIIVNQDIIIDSQPQPEVITCEGESSIVLSVSVTGDISNYLWRKDGIPISDPAKYAGEETAQLTISNISTEDAGNYDVVISSPDGSCSQIISNPGVLIVSELPEIEAIGAYYEACFDGSTPINITTGALVDESKAIIEWSVPSGTGTISNPNSLTGATFTPDENFDESNPVIITLKAFGINGCSAEEVSATKELTFSRQPVLNSFSYTASEFCASINSGQNPNLTGENNFQGGTFSAVYNDGGSGTLNIDSNTGVITPAGSTVGSYTVTYTTPDDGICNPVSSSFDVTIGPLPIADFSYPDSPFCSNSENPLPTMATGAEKGVFSSTTGLAFVDTSTGEIDLASSEPGTYTITNTIAPAGGCEEVTATTDITITKLPVAIFSYQDTPYCSNDPNPIVTLGSDAQHGEYTSTEGLVFANSNTGEIDMAASTPGAYTVTNTIVAANGCEEVTATANITITKLPVADFSYANLNEENAVCISEMVLSIGEEPDPNGTYSSTTLDSFLDVNTGEINWGVISQIPVGEHTITYTIPESEGCPEVSHSETIRVDALPEGGALAWDNDERIFLTCEVQTNTLNEVLSLSGQSGQIMEWQYRTVSSGVWQTYDSQNPSINRDDFESILGNSVESTVFRVRIANGACDDPDNPVYSQTAILSVIPDDIKPSPVESDPDVLCYNELVTLSSETGYGSEAGKFEGGAFDQAGLDNNGSGWNFTNPDGSPFNFEGSVNNGRSSTWGRMNPHGSDPANEKVYNANIPNPELEGTMVNYRTYSGNAGNKGFALVTGDNDSHMETPVFSLTGLDEAILTWDQAYNLTENAVIMVEISRNGGNSYPLGYPIPELEDINFSHQDIIYFKVGDGTISTGSSGNFDHFGEGDPGINQMSIDLGDYLGETNLRVRFTFIGTIDGDVWAVDNIKVPDGPQKVQLIWYYDHSPETGSFDPNDPDLEQIGEVNQTTVSYPQNGNDWPTLGWNDFEVRTALILDSNGDPCESINNFETIQVFVFDKYTSTVTAEAGECGNTRVQLSATVTGDFQGDVTSELIPLSENEDPPTTVDGYKGVWVITGEGEYTLINPDGTTTPDPINNPNAILEAEGLGDFSFSYELIPTAVYPDNYKDETLRGQLVENLGCPPESNIVEVQIPECTTLDFDGVDDYVSIEDIFADARTFEMWIYPEASTGTIISGPGIEIQMSDLPAAVTPNSRWYHISLIGSKLYIDGIDSGVTITGGTGTGNKTYIGAKWNTSEKKMDEFFSGWIEEVRIWKTLLDIKEIRFMMNQRLDLSSKGEGEIVQGEVVPNLSINGSYLTQNINGENQNLHFDGSKTEPFYNVNWDDLISYYRLISAEPDPDLGIIPDTYKPVAGFSPNLALTGVNARLHNMTTHQQNTSPTPYFSFRDNQTWETDNTWARPNVWDTPNSNGIKNTPIEWNIARINHNIFSGNKNITMLGLLSETPGKELSVESIPNDHFIRISHYLLLDGNMDLEGESQLLQDHGSILDNKSSGWLEANQEGRMSSFNYNYWTSPVSNQGTANNSGFSLDTVLLNGDKENDPDDIKFLDGYFSADGPKSNPMIISNEWIWDFRGGDADVYGKWLHLGSDYLEIVGAGYSMKGTTGSAGLNDKQKYTFRGKPNNGNIPYDSLKLGNNQNYLVGNPYPSAIDAHEFLKDNLNDLPGNDGTNAKNENVFNGTLYYWDHFDGYTHILEEYIGGYAVYSLAGNIEAASSIDSRINDNQQDSPNGKPQRYIPVAQGFFLNSTSLTVFGQTYNFSGNIIFKNTQRVFETISGGNTTFKNQEGQNIKGQRNKTNEDNRTKIRVKFESPKGFHRQILVTKDEKTSNGFDIGYDAPLIENNIEDMYWWLGGHGFVIQGVPDFEKEQILPLAIKTKEGGEFKIKIDATENWPEGKELYLKDKTIDTIHDILKEDYIGKIEDAGEITDRFELIFFKEKALDPDDIINPDLPILDGIVGISYSRFDKQVKISNFDLLEVDKVMIFDLGGKLIQQFDELPTEKEIRLGMRPVRSGVYIVKVYCENGICNKKIIIE
ncbi:Ig-like domain-containing protein [Christiangramia gaetbulicola]|uniref:Ig-like domain-containing protein n=1 Tax=Christiangramia gaetbulicola TaxID=703340 RepID=A0A2T6AK77_9FLAO|nr:immunoglobulin domain-containing protein [Christiangramia gaetbulicola]PTX44228.1 Ig-like domain-containing protein [Christiangramia gaetbulicola]